MDFYTIGLIIIGVLAFIIIGGMLFSKIKISKDSIELDKKDTPDMKVKQKSDLKKIKEVVELVEQKAYESGFEVGKMKNKTILDAQKLLAEEQIIALREKIMMMLCQMSKNHNENDSTMFLNIVTLYFNIFISSLRTSFELNNWKSMSQSEFDDMINRKINLLLSEWKRVVNIYYISKFSTVPQQKILELIDDVNNIELFELFTNTIKTIFAMAKRLKYNTDDRVEIIKKDMHSYNEALIKASIDNNEQKQSKS